MRRLPDAIAWLLASLAVLAFPLAVVVLCWLATLTS